MEGAVLILEAETGEWPNPWSAPITDVEGGGDDVVLAILCAIPRITDQVYIFCSGNLQ